MFAKLFSVNDFVAWMEEARIRRGWTQAELARRAGVSQAAISRVMSGTRGVGVELCRSIADALGVPEKEALRAAGLLKDDAEPAPGQDEMAYIYAHLPPEQQEHLRDYARFLLDKQERQQTRPNPNPANAR